jgi:bifunctional non-homologous end joining protein LigD
LQLQAEFPVTITNPEKLLWPERAITKADYIHYIIQMSPYLLHHLANRPLTVIRYPDGIHGHSFYQKNKPVGTPEWVTTIPLWSPDRKDFIEYIVVDSVSTLIWLANLACLEFHVGFTTIQSMDSPTSVAFDLDPSVPGFERVRKVALALHEILDQMGMPHMAKTSGATGLQVFIPLTPGHTFEDTRLFTKTVAEYLEARLPHLVTLERLKKRRGTKVYIDYLQHGHNRTLIAPYSTRATIHATVSTPISWKELQEGAVPEDFTLKNVPARVEKVGDLMEGKERASLTQIVQFLSNHKL